MTNGMTDDLKKLHEELLRDAGSAADAAEKDREQAKTVPAAERGQYAGAAAALNARSDALKSAADRVGQILHDYYVE